MSSEIQTVGGWIDVSQSVQFLARNLGNLRGAFGLGDGVEEAVNKWVRISLSTDACESAMEKACVLKHFPHGWIAPIVGDGLWEYFDLEVIMSSRKYPRTCKHFLNVQANQVLSSFLKCVIECLLIFLSLALSIWNQAISVTHKYQDSSRVYSVKGGNICYRVWGHENERELFCIENFISCRFKVSSCTRSMELVCCFLRFLREIKWTKLILFMNNSRSLLILRHLSIIILKVFSASKLLHHDHLIFPHLWGNLKESIFLLILSQIDNISPSLLIFSLESS